MLYDSCQPPCRKHGGRHRPIAVGKVAVPLEAFAVIAGSFSPLLHLMVKYLCHYSSWTYCLAELPGLNGSEDEKIVTSSDSCEMEQRRSLKIAKMKSENQAGSTVRRGKFQSQFALEATY